MVLNISEKRILVFHEDWFQQPVPPQCPEMTANANTILCLLKPILKAFKLFQLNKKYLIDLWYTFKAPVGCNNKVCPNLIEQTSSAISIHFSWQIIPKLCTEHISALCKVLEWSVNLKVYPGCKILWVFSSWQITDGLAVPFHPPEL